MHIIKFISQFYKQEKEIMYYNDQMRKIMTEEERNKADQDLF